MRNPFAFDELLYLELNPDVEAAVRRGDFESGRAHWIKHGRGEGRPRRREDLVLSVPGAPKEWDEGRYLRRNPDVALAIKSGVFSSGYAHWSEFGQDEGRNGGLSAIRLANPDEVFQKYPPGVNYFSFQSLKIGLSVAAEGYLGLLRRIAPAVKEVAVPVWGKKMMAKLDYDPERAPYAINVVHQNPNMVPFFLHHFGRKTVEDRFNIGVWVWELHAGYAEWHQVSRMFHEVWAPTSWVADVLRPICQAPIVRVPHVVDGLPDSPCLRRSDLGLPEDALVFLYVFDAGSSLQRKNPMGLVRAFRKAFGDRKDVALLLKYHRGESDPRGVRILEQFAAANPNIRTIASTMSEEQVYSLFQICDCFVSPHRSEGFGLNIAQAMYYGKPVIATGYSGNMDFTNAENSFLVDYDLIPLETDYDWYRKGYVWAEPSVDHLAALLQRVAENREAAAQVGRLGQLEVKKQFSREAVLGIIRSIWRAPLSPGIRPTGR